MNKLLVRWVTRDRKGETTLNFFGVFDSQLIADNHIKVFMGLFPHIPYTDFLFDEYTPNTLFVGKSPKGDPDEIAIKVNLLAK